MWVQLQESRLSVSIYNTLLLQHVLVPQGQQRSLFILLFITPALSGEIIFVPEEQSALPTRPALLQVLRLLQDPHIAGTGRPLPLQYGPHWQGLLQLSPR